VLDFIDGKQPLDQVSLNKGKCQQLFCVHLLNVELAVMEERHFFLNGNSRKLDFLIADGNVAMTCLWLCRHLLRRSGTTR
jgi:hypothetical protein